MTSKIAGLFTSKSEKKRIAELARQKLIAKITNTICREVDRETKELSKRLQKNAHIIVEQLITKQHDDSQDIFC